MIYEMKNGNTIRVNYCIQNGETTSIEYTVIQKDGYWKETITKSMPNSMFESEYLFLSDEYNLKR